MPQKHILLSAGDDSGDTHAANLMRAIRRVEPDVRFSGIGMRRMVEEGMAAALDEAAGGSTMWLQSIARSLHFRGRLMRLCRHMEADPPDLVIPVDFGGFNLCLCQQAARRGLPVFYYIPPQVWAHGTYRLKKLRKWTTRCGLIYPFEPELYEAWGVAAEYVGHPLFDEIAADPPSEKSVADLRERFGEDLIAVFPGSRRQEVLAHMRMLRQAAESIRRAVPGARFVILCPQRVRDCVADLVAGEDSPFEVLEDGRPVELARAARLCLTKSGTITLEIASQGTPMVIFYRTNPMIGLMAWGLSHTPYVGLVNNLAGRMICPERPSVRNSARWIAEQALRLLTDEAAYEECRRDIAAVLAQAGGPGASGKAAASALSLT